MPSHRFLRLCGLALFSSYLAIATCESRLHAAEVTARLIAAPDRVTTRKAAKAPPAVIWLKAVQSGNFPSVTPGSFTLTQKNKMFMPHLLVVPVGSSVAFPNADPFFHNVFSLFEGKRFDLGLYEAGSTRSVVFSREGVSYIFCNIHSEMSAVVIALTTPFYSVADSLGQFHMRPVPAGDYELHVWVEGQHQDFLDQQTRRVHIAGDAVNLGEIRSGPPDHDPHLNKFGRPYDPEAKPPY